MDKYGNYYCVDRLKELIKYSKRISPLIHTTTCAADD